MAVTITLGSLTVNDANTAAADGDGNVWSWSEFDGWWGNPAPTMWLLELDGKVSPTARRYRGRPMTLTGFVNTGNNATRFHAAMDKLEASFDLVESTGTLTVNEATPKQVTVVLNGSIDVKPLHMRGIRWQVPLLAGDPRKYATSATSGAVSGSLTNSGNTATLPTWTVTGASTNPQLTLGGSTVKFSYSLAGGSTLVVDFAARTAVVNGTTSVIGNLDGVTTPGWFTVAPGSNSFTAAGGGTHSVSFRSAWI